MPVEFSSIYSKAVGLFQDPFITNAFNTSPIDFFQIMFTYFQNALPRFNNPSNIQSILSLVNIPTGQSELFVGNGSTVIYTLSTTPFANSYFDYTVNNVTTNINPSSYNSVTNQITLPSPIVSGENVIIRWYFAGEFIDPNGVLDITVQDILARLTVLQWQESEKNFLLDIRRLLGDTDFKLISEANSLNSKVKWHSVSRESVEKMMNQYSWSLRFKNWTQTGSFT